MTDQEKRDHAEGVAEGAPASMSDRRDATDLGVPMEQARERDRVRPPGPEDAMDPTVPTRGDYSGRIGRGIHYETRITGHREDGSPIIEAVRQN